jgi:diaminohydroxyphosphoribosylaminopyrimidine deaminase/5-amino-6-(5-phosphoribosylamino)uracil reductase
MTCADASALRQILAPSRPEDAGFMRLALDEARKACGRTSPNPVVGTIIVKDGVILGQGHHLRAGLDHGEVAALRDVRARGNDPHGATVYVNLEPCCHYARTPPCTEACLEAGVARVVASMVDPDPRVSGKGLALLHDAGIVVTVGVLEDEARALNAPFLTRISLGRPHVTVKVAMSLDGRIATTSGESFPLTGSRARERVHQLRDRMDAILVGRGTIDMDNPRLTCRLPEDVAGDGGPNDPVRIVIDPDLRCDLGSKVFHLHADGDSPVPTVLVMAHDAVIDPERLATLDALKVQVLRSHRGDAGRLDLAQLLRSLVEMNLSSVLLEGGTDTISGFYEAGLVDAWIAHVAPVLIGGEGAPAPLTGVGVASLEGLEKIRGVKVTRLGDDIELAAPVAGDVYGIG